MDVRAFIRDITSDRRYRGQIVACREIPAREAQYAEPAQPIPDLLRALLRRQNIWKLYSHQAAAIDAINQGRDVVIVTGTASGKTLCYNLPVAGDLLHDPQARHQQVGIVGGQARALYIYPTKALAQDQFGLLKAWAADDEQLARVLLPAVYDGDTPAHNRGKIRSDCSVILTNPDMLHVGILPYHAKWHRFLRQLRTIVIDEVHSYRGIFGSHVAGVLRRLLRVCEHYGSRPRIVCSSATIANPVELAQTLTGREMTLIDNDGAPRGRRFFVLWNPPFIEGTTGVSPVSSQARRETAPAVAPETARRETAPAVAPLQSEQILRRSANVEAVDLLVELVRRRVQTIAFAKARIVAELVYKYAREELRRGAGGSRVAGVSPAPLHAAETAATLADRIRPYRGGYLPNERREIEQQLFSGQLLAVVATNALELGINVGGLDAAILVGFPGTICSTWQQAGRAGRGGDDSLVIMIAYNDPVDQYLMRHPEYLFGASHEHAVIDPSNPYILSGQVSCACFEKPITADDEKYFGPLVTQVAQAVAEDGEMRGIDGRWYWSSSKQPSHQVSLRTISQNTYAIVNSAAGGKTIGQVDAISAPELVYPEAVYLHEGESYLVKQLDLEAKIAYVEPCQVDYYTQAVLASSCRIIEQREEQPYRDGRTAFGDLDVTWQTTAFRKVKYYTMELIGQAALDLPAQTLATAGTWWTISEEMRKLLGQAGYNPIEALMGVRNLMLAGLPSLAMCDRRDISGMVNSSNLGAPTIFIYDRYPGGVGFAQRGWQLMDDWLAICRSIVNECPCQGGCPSCVGLANLRPPLHHDPDLGGGYPVPDKQATMHLLRMLE